MPNRDWHVSDLLNAIDRTGAYPGTYEPWLVATSVLIAICEFAPNGDPAVSVRSSTCSGAGETRRCKGRIRAVIRARAQAAVVSDNEMTERALGNVSLRCFVTQQYIANMAICLCSPFGATISGQARSVDGDVQVLI